MLKAYEVAYIFGVPGDTSIKLYEALYDHGNPIKHILARDERSASFMADAYARLSHKPGICECPSGQGLDEAFSSHEPVFLNIKSEPESEGIPPVYSWKTLGNDK